MLLSPTGCVQLAACRLQDAKKHALYYRLAAAGLVDNEYAAALKENAAITATAQRAPWAQRCAYREQRLAPRPKARPPARTLRVTPAAPGA